MKVIKKITAIMLSIMMVLGLSSVVSAAGATTSGTSTADKGKITTPTIFGAVSLLLLSSCCCLHCEVNNTSTFLYKCRSTLRATYLNLSFSSRNTDFLLTTRTFINMINFSLFHQFFLLVEKTTKLICLCEIFLILRITFCYVF